MDGLTPKSSLSLRITSFGMHGFNGSWSYLHNLCNKYDIIILQELFMDCQLHHLNSVSSDFCVHAKSHMTTSCGYGI